MVAHHESFGKILAAFELSAGLARTDDGDMAERRILFKIIVNTFDQRVFGTHHHHIYLIGQGEILDGGEIVGLHIDVCAHLSRSGITGGDEKMLYFRTLSYFPSDGVLATA